MLIFLSIVAAIRWCKDEADWSSFRSHRCRNYIEESITCAANGKDTVWCEQSPIETAPNPIETSSAIRVTNANATSACCVCGGGEDGKFQCTEDNKTQCLHDICNGDTCIPKPETELKGWCVVGDGKVLESKCPRDVEKGCESLKDDCKKKCQYPGCTGWSFRSYNGTSTCYLMSGVETKLRRKYIDETCISSLKQALPCNSFVPILPTTREFGSVHISNSCATVQSDGIARWLRTTDTSFTVEMMLNSTSKSSSLIESDEFRLHLSGGDIYLDNERIAPKSPRIILTINGPPQSVSVHVGAVHRNFNLAANCRNCSVGTAVTRFNFYDAIVVPATDKWLHQYDVGMCVRGNANLTQQNLKSTNHTLNHQLRSMIQQPLGKISMEDVIIVNVSRQDCTHGRLLRSTNQYASMKLLISYIVRVSERDEGNLRKLSSEDLSDEFGFMIVRPPREEPTQPPTQPPPRATPTAMRQAQASISAHSFSAGYITLLVFAGIAVACSFSLACYQCIAPESSTLPPEKYCSLRRRGSEPTTEAVRQVMKKDMLKKNVRTVEEPSVAKAALPLNSARPEQVVLKPARDTPSSRLPSETRQLRPARLPSERVANSATRDTRPNPKPKREKQPLDTSSAHLSTSGKSGPAHLSTLSRPLKNRRVLSTTQALEKV